MSVIAPIKGLIRNDEKGILLTEHVYMKECQWSGFVDPLGVLHLHDDVCNIFKKISASDHDFNEKSLWHRILVGLHVMGAKIKPDAKITIMENEILRKFEMGDMAFYHLPKR